MTDLKPPFFFSRINSGSIRAAIFLTLSMLFTAAVAADPLQVHSGWMRAVPPVANNSAAYLTLVNKGETAVQLAGASSPVAGAIELHQVVSNEGVMRMMPAGTVMIPAGGHIEMKPGEYHLMMLDLKRVPGEGETVTLTLHFEKADDMTIQIPVRRSDNIEHAHHH